VIETQATIGRWADETFPGGDPLSPRHVIRLLEEVVELALASGASWREIFNAVGESYEPTPFRPVDVRTPEPPEKVAREMADCAIVLDVLAERRGVDLRAEVDAKMKINRARKWKVNNDGTGYHIREGT
jgi:hypothetical protein